MMRKAKRRKKRRAGEKGRNPLHLFVTAPQKYKARESMFAPSLLFESARTRRRGWGKCPPQSKVRPLPIIACGEHWDFAARFCSSLGPWRHMGSAIVSRLFPSTRRRKITSALVD
ncbi:hypothetical protein BT93_F2508 [Corymbia citriodora subsp. variegata]|nr:hypothetical protein BT93_F2508 [Corymbia citriodora subsp. variegata]